MHDYEGEIEYDEAIANHDIADIRGQATIGVKLADLALVAIIVVLALNTMNGRKI